MKRQNFTVFMLIGGILAMSAGLIAVQKSVIQQNEASTIIGPSCTYKTATCSVASRFVGGSFRITVFEDGKEIQPTGSPGQDSVAFPASPSKKYFCKVVILDSQGSPIEGPDCSRTVSGQPACVPKTTPIITLPVTPFVPATPTPILIITQSVTPTPAVPLSCPNYDYNIILRPTLSCPQIMWECSIPDLVHQKFKTDGIDYRLIVSFQKSQRVERGVLNFPRVQFKPDNAQNFTCRLDVIGKTGKVLTCDSNSGRQTCDSPKTTQSLSTQTCTVSGTDLNHDGTISTIDAGIFIKKYLTNNTEADLNCDGSLDKFDWDIMRTSSFGPQ